MDKTLAFDTENLTEEQAREQTQELLVEMRRRLDAMGRSDDRIAASHERTQAVLDGLRRPR